MEAEDDQICVHCPELGVSSCADTPDEARAYIQEAVELYLETLEEIGETPKRLVVTDSGPHV
jgi:predicted RNase H-like HicB family nuclease